MESSLLATPILLQALENGRFDAASLSAYQTAFREYFDPSMLFSEFCACLLRNRSLRRSWLNAAVRGCHEAQENHESARTAGACFGGIQLQPLAVLLRVASMALSQLLNMWSRAFAPTAGSRDAAHLKVADLLGWQADLVASFLANPIWHGQWMLDLQSSWLRAAAVLGRQNLRYTVCGLDPP
jgi:menaquinone-9 beta-reductase